jgi:FixJ family two-component response regulator
LSRDLCVYIVDDDAAVRDSLGLLLGVLGYRIALFASGEAFLAALRDDWTGCVLIDVRMPGMDGLSLQHQLTRRGCQLPVIIITGHGDVDLARHAFKAHAKDFLEKPFDEDKLIKAIDEAFEDAARGLQAQRAHAGTAELMARLTPREREVATLVVAGRHNRDIALALAISVRTVEVHKARLMTKLQVDNVADLVRISLRGDPN